MSKRFFRNSVLLLLAAMLLGGCFREASPGVAPTTSSAGETESPRPSPTRLLTTPTAFVTPFATGAGPDTTLLPTSGEPSATIPVAVPGAGETAVATTPASANPGATNTIPFASGPTFTPIPGAPTTSFSANPNPGGLQATPTVLQETVEAADDPCTYVVQPGDTAYQIAIDHGLTLTQLIEANDLENPNRLSEGETLNLPGCGASPTPPSVVPGATVLPGVVSTPTSAPSSGTPRPGGGQVHVVQAGENLFRIALRYGVTVDQIVQANNLGSAEAIIQPGQELIIP